MADLKQIDKKESPKKETYADKYKKVYGKSHLTPEKKPPKEKPAERGTLQKLWDFVTGPSKRLEEAAKQ